MQSVYGTSSDEKHRGRAALRRPITDEVAVMDDIELLELAAKAAGVEIAGFSVSAFGPMVERADGGWWDPLDDDGDAFRLSAGLFNSIEYVVDEWPDDESGMMRQEVNMPNTRRAIVRAAAEIGRLM